MESSLQGKESLGQRSDDIKSPSSDWLLCLVIIDFIFGFIIVTGNASLFITICRDPCKCLRSPSTFLIANLSVADFFMGTVSLLRAAELLYKYNGIPDVPVLNIAGYFIGAVSILAAVSTLMAMSYERYVAIIKPFRYPQAITTKRVKVAMAGIWVNAFVMCILPLSSVKQEIFLFTYCYSHFVIPSFVLTVMYVKIYKQIALLRKELKEVRASLSAVTRTRQLERERRMVIAFILILILFYLSFLPYFVFVQILFFWSLRDSGALYVFRLIANEFLTVSSLVDPFMYAWRLPKFNRSLRLCFQLLKGRNVVTVWTGTTSHPHHKPGSPVLPKELVQNSYPHGEAGMPVTHRSKNISPV